MFLHHSPTCFVESTFRLPDTHTPNNIPHSSSRLQICPLLRQGPQIHYGEISARHYRERLLIVGLPNFRKLSVLTIVLELIMQILAHFFKSCAPLTFYLSDEGMRSLAPIGMQYGCVFTSFLTLNCSITELHEFDL